MHDVDAFLDLSLAGQASTICLVICAAALFVILLTAPQRDCFFLRWTAPVRFLALIVLPALFIVWSIILYGWFLKSRGIGPEDMDYFDED